MAKYAASVSSAAIGAVTSPIERLDLLVPLAPRSGERVGVRGPAGRGWRYAARMTRVRAISCGFAVALAAAAAASAASRTRRIRAPCSSRGYCDIYKPCCVAAGLPGDGTACRALFASAASPQASYSATAGEACLSGLQAISGQPGFCEGDVVPPLHVRPGVRWRGRRVHPGQRLPGAGRRATRAASPVSRTARTSASVRSRSGARSVARRASAACAATSPSTAERPATSPTWAISATRTTASAATATAARVSRSADVGGPCELSSDCGGDRLLRRDHGPVRGAQTDRRGLHRPRPLECEDGSFLRRASLLCVRAARRRRRLHRQRPVPHRQLPERHLPADADRSGANPLCGG